MVAGVLADDRRVGATLCINSGCPYELRRRGQVVACATLLKVMQTLRAWAGVSP